MYIRFNPLLYTPGPGLPVRGGVIIKFVNARAINFLVFHA